MSIISASTLTNTALQYTADTTGTLVFKTGATPTTALTIDSTQGLTYTGTLTGGTGVVNLGSGQFYKDASGNVGIGTSSPASYGKLTVWGGNAFIQSTTASVGAKITLSDTNNSAYISSAPSGVVTGLAFGIGSTEAMRIDSSGNVGIGTSSPAAKLQVTTVTNDGTTPSNAWDNKFLAVVPSGTSTGNGIGLSADTATNTGYITAARPGVAWSSIGYRGLNHLFYASGTTEAMRIDSSGNVLIGTTSYGPQTTRLNLKYAGSEIWSVGPTSGSSTFYVATGTTGVFLTSTGTSWSAISDERKKDIIEPIVDATQKVLQLRAVIGKYKTDKAETRRSFLIAQDVRAVLPEAVSEDEIGTLGLAYTDVIPLLVAAIQEQQAMIEELKANAQAQAAEIKALKGVA